MDPVSFRARFAGWLIMGGVGYIILLFILPYSVLINVLTTFGALLFAGGYYALWKTNPTIPDEKPETWKFSMWCWIALAALQIMPLIF